VSSIVVDNEKRGTASTAIPPYEDEKKKGAFRKI
jgi:hypothetical protein